MAAPPPSYEEAQGYTSAPQGSLPYPQPAPYPAQQGQYGYRDASKGNPMNPGYPQQPQMPYPTQAGVPPQYPYGAPVPGFNQGQGQYMGGQQYIHPTATYNPQAGGVVQTYPMAPDAIQRRRKNIIIIICIIVIFFVGLGAFMRLIF